MEEQCQAIRSTNHHSSAFHRPSFVFGELIISQLMYMSIAWLREGCKSTQSIRQVCKQDQEFDMFHQQERMHDPKKIKWEKGGEHKIVQCAIGRSSICTFEYIKLNGKLMAIDKSQTKKIFSMTRFRVLFRPNRIGYRRDKYRSMEIVHKCIILAVQKRTSKHIHARQCSDCNGKYPGMRKMFTVEIDCWLKAFCVDCGFLLHTSLIVLWTVLWCNPLMERWLQATTLKCIRNETFCTFFSICMQMNFSMLGKHHLHDVSSRILRKAF